MTFIQKNSIKKLVREKGFRISPSSFDGINRSVRQLIINMLARVDQDGMKTLMDQHTGNIKPTKKTEKTITKNSCKRCCNIKPEFIKFAKSTQDWCHTKATILSRKV